jgi:hypothetical protein
MTNNSLKTGAEQTPEMVCLRNVPQRTDDVQLTIRA